MDSLELVLGEKKINFTVSTTYQKIGAKQFLNTRSDQYI